MTDLQTGSSNTVSAPAATVGSSTYNINSASSLGFTDDQINSLMSNIVVANEGNGIPLYVGKTGDNIFNFQSLKAGSGIIITQNDDGTVLISYSGLPTPGYQLAKVATTGSYTDLVNTPDLITSIGGLSDVNVTSPISDQILSYNGVRWVNTTLNLEKYIVLDSEGDGVQLIDTINGNSIVQKTLKAGPGITISEISGSIVFESESSNTTVWLYGTSDPTSQDGTVNDFYLNTTSNDVFQCSLSGWTKIGNIQGPIGATGLTGPEGPSGERGTDWTFGIGIPTIDVAIKNDMYLDTSSYDIYSYTGSIWILVGNIKGSIGPQGSKGDTGETGTRGSIWTSGKGSPVDNGLAGDMYLNTSTGDVYIFSTMWNLIENIIGPQGIQGPVGDVGPVGNRGSTWTSDAGIPTSTDADSGDMYLNTTTSDLYQYDGTKWNLVANIKGPQGIQGIQGIQGPQGQSLVNKGTWVESSIYEPNDYVFYATSSSIPTLSMYVVNGTESFTSTKEPYSDTTNWSAISGPQGQRGSLWYTGDSTPSSANSNDMYIDDNGNISQYNGISWSPILSIKGADGKDGTDGTNGTNGTDGKNGSIWTTGSGVPTSTTSNTDDMYLDTASDDVYQYDGTKWDLIANIKGSTGIQGPQGEPGTGLTNKGTWVSGDSYNSGDYVFAISAEGSTSTSMFICQSSSTLVSTKEPYSDTTNWVEFSAPQGQRGSLWSVGSGVPNISTGYSGDMYLNSLTGDVYQYDGSSWSKVENIIGPAGPTGLTGSTGATGPAGKDGTDGNDGQRGSTWTVDTATPSTTGYLTGDMFLNSSTYDIYQFNGTSWIKDGNIKGSIGDTGATGAQGLQGQRGSTWETGTAVPTASDNNINGDMYLDTATSTVYQYDGTKWNSLSNIKGATGPAGIQGPIGDTGATGATGQRGSTWTLGTSAPTSTINFLENDMYLNTNSFEVYQFDGTQWLEYGSIKGAAGSTGAAGTDGTRGSSWTTDTINPSSVTGFLEGDMWLNTTSYEIYKFNGSSWVDEGNISSKIPGIPSDLTPYKNQVMMVNSDGTAVTFVTLAELNEMLQQSSYPSLGFSSSTLNVSVVVDPSAFPPTVASGRYSTFKNQIIDDTQSPYRIKMVNCFGFEGTHYFPLDCWNRSYTKIIDDMKSMGFNTIRIPFSGQAVTENPTPPQDGSAFNVTADSALVGKTFLECLDAFIAYAGSVDMGILLDYHRQEAGSGTDGTPVEPTEGSQYTLAYAISAWQTLATRYKDNTAVIGADLYNEPYQLDWATWVGYAEQMGNAIQAIAPEWLLFVEGVGTYNSNSYWWGGQLEGAGTTIPTFTNSNKLVFSPHEYGLSASTLGGTATSNVSWLKTPTSTPINWPQSLYTGWNTNWGFIYTQEIAPVVIGETGGLFGYNLDGTAMTDNTYYDSADEIAWFTKLMDYINGDFDGSGENGIASGNEGIGLGYWAYQADSSDVGGLITTDYVTHQHYKLQLMQSVLGTSDDDQSS